MYKGTKKEKERTRRYHHNHYSISVCLPLSLKEPVEKKLSLLKITKTEYIKMLIEADLYGTDRTE